MKGKRGRPPDEGLRVARREQILATAAGVFADRGFAGTDVEEIAGSAGIGKGTVYRYFPTKERLFLATVDRSMRLLGERVEAEAAGASGPLDRIRRGVMGYLAFFDERPGTIELFIQERASFRDRKQSTYSVHRIARSGPWKDLLRGLIAEGVVRNLPVDAIADTINDLLYGTIFTNHLEGGRRSFEKPVGVVLDILFHGILVEGGPSGGRGAGGKR